MTAGTLQQRRQKALSLQLVSTGSLYDTYARDTPEYRTVTA